MLIKILGIFDLIAALLFWSFAFFGLFSSLILFAAFYLLIKGTVFLISKDIASILDVISSIVMFLALNFTLPKFVILLVTIYLLQKGIFSLLS